MKEIRYKNFSWQIHKKNWRIKKQNVCQFELSFGCGLHCQHCYIDCYNKAPFIKKELNTNEVKFILNKVYKAGVLWLCFTGGDPLTRADFLDIYSYAKNKGFIISVFTNGYSMTAEIAAYLQKKPPFMLEITLNAVTEDLYEKLSQVKGSFKKAMYGINLILKAKLPLKIKTQITRDNLEEIPGIKKFIERLGLKFRATPDLFARLNGDLMPCNLRISPDEVLSLNENKRISDNDCQLSLQTEKGKPQTDLFRCAIGSGDGINIDPYGNMFLCNLIRKPAFNLLKIDIEYAFNKLLPLVKDRKFVSNSKCNGCDLRDICAWCPGRAYVETANLEGSIEYYCRLAELEEKQEVNMIRS